MTYVVAGDGGTWEIRESHTTEAGPRSRTLATFRTLTPAVIERARARSSQALDAAALRKAARRAGAPVAAAAPDSAAAELLTELAAGNRPRPVLARLLADALSVDASGPLSPAGRTVAPADGIHLTDSARAAAAWVAASPQRRGEALHDLLLVADHLPRARTRERARFPHIASRAL